MKRLGETDKSVFALVEKARGHRRAISRNYIAAVLKITDRQVRTSIERLKAQGVAIGCLWRPGGGYFLMTTPEDIEMGERQYRKQALTMLRRLGQAMTPKQRLEFAGQVRMVLDGEPISTLDRAPEDQELMEA